jgi:predicted dehydrogenase
MTTRIAIIGCGFVSDYYLASLRLHPQLDVAGVFDRDPERSAAVARTHAVPAYASLEQILDDRSVGLVVNLTSPESHFEVSAACLEAGKSVYSEKPLATDLADARRLCELAERQRLGLACAPCSVLGEAAQTAWKALRDRRVGEVRVVYAEMEDGMVHRMPYRKWRSRSGAPWPYRSEFETGCILEHAGYSVSWLPAFFGPAVSITSFSDCLIDDKGVEPPLRRSAPDFAVACIVFASGVVARLTCGIVAPRDHSLRIVGDGGVMTVADCWDFASPVRIRRPVTIRRRTLFPPWRSTCRPVRPIGGVRRLSPRYDYSRGVADLADAVRTGQRPGLPRDFCLHVNEISLAIHGAGAAGGTYRLTTSFAPLDPMPWAR